MILWLLILYILLVSEFKGKVSVLLGRCCWRDIAVCLPALDTEALICMEEAVESKVTHSILLFFPAPPCASEYDIHKSDKDRYWTENDWSVNCQEIDVAYK